MADPLLGAAVVRAGAEVGEPPGAVLPPLARSAGARVAERPKMARLLDAARPHPLSVVPKPRPRTATAGLVATRRKVVDVRPGQSLSRRARPGPDGRARGAPKATTARRDQAAASRTTAPTRTATAPAVAAGRVRAIKAMAGDEKGRAGAALTVAPIIRAPYPSLAAAPRVVGARVEVRPPEFNGREATRERVAP